MKNTVYGIVFLFFIFLCSCENDRLKVDVSETGPEQIFVKRLEQDLFKMDTSRVVEESEKLQKKYGNFYPAFISRIINNGGLNDSSYAFRITQFISDRDMREAYEDIQKKYPDTKALEAEMANAFRHFKYYFPDKKLPQIVTMMSGFNQSIVPLDSTLAIGLEMYLGKDDPFYQMLQMPRYKTNFMNKENVVPDAI
ncbi:MAG: hypothetical protein M3R27_11800, partial [Bacteroidota bacterium]|nr:hypothetical protein [Bacteroidota bacterium]